MLIHTNDGLTTLLNISKNVVGTLDLQKILQETVDGISQLFGLGSAAIYLCEPNRMARLQATFPPLPSHFPEHFRLAKLDDHPSLAAAIETGRPVHIPDVKKVSLTPMEQVVNDQRNLRTLLFVPLLSEAEVMGAFIVGSVGEPVDISVTEIDLACTLANFAALAIKNARLFEAGKNYAKQLEQTIIERDDAEKSRQQLQQELFQIQKLDAIGQLAGGVAHDFNNQLGGILGYAELLRMQAKDGEMFEYASHIITLAQRSAELTTQLLAFSRKGQYQLVTLDVHEVIGEVVGILKHTIPKNIEVCCRLDANTHHTQGDPTQIQNALLNLALNARDAMPKGGQLTFTTELHHFDEARQDKGAFGLAPGHYIQISVSDTGVGMSADILARMYDPFFTTKKRGEGTGMGLAAVYGTVKAHSGGIDVTSLEGEGTTFLLYLPINGGTAEPARISEEPQSVLQEGTKILVIDDEELVAEVTSTHLARMGYYPYSFTDSREAISFFETNHASIALVLLDMIMPKMNGPEMYAALKAIDPGVRVVLTSGYSPGTETQSLLSLGANGFLQKPYRSSDLKKLLNKVLRKPSRPPSPNKSQTD